MATEGPRRAERGAPSRGVGKRSGNKRDAATLAKFKKAYLTNGHNATEAAIAIGHPRRSARTRAWQLMRLLRPELEAEARLVAEEAHIETVRTLREVGRILFLDPATMFDPDGEILPIDLMPADTRAAIQSFELDADGRPRKVKFWSKVDALDKAMRHLGLFERDNRQRVENLAIQINLVGEPEPPAQPRDVTIEATLVDPPARNGHANGKNGSHP